ncbi:MAG: hypothetical protein ACOZAO_00255 [Patescibacteria group bacterium]
MSKKNWILLVLVLVFALFVVACGEENTEVPLDLGEPTAIATIDGESVQNALNNRPEAETAEAEAMPAATATTIVERIEVEVEATRIVEVPVEVEVEVPVEGTFRQEEFDAALQYGRAVPGLVAGMDATFEEPEIWESTENVVCQWGTPHVVEGNAPDAAPGVLFTDCYQFEVSGGASYTVTLHYGRFDYFNGDLEQEVTHSTYLQQLYFEGDPQGMGLPSNDGLSAWAVAGSWINVQYPGEPMQTNCGSVELLPGIDIKLGFHNSPGQTAAKFTIGPWGDINDQGTKIPVCRPSTQAFYEQAEMLWAEQLRVEYCERIEDKGIPANLDPEFAVTYCEERGITLDPTHIDATVSTDD